MAGPRQAKKEQDSAKGARILIVEARYYDDLADALLTGAMVVLEKAGVEVERISVPGSLEIPGAIAIALEAARRKRRTYDGIVALGCVIRGDTIHFEIVSQEFGARPDGVVDAARAADRQRHHHRQHPVAGFRARPHARDGQRRRRRPRRAGDGPRQTSACRQMSKARAATEAKKANKRGAARLAAVQALYQMDLAGTGLNEILAEFESHWLGGDVEGAQYLPAEAAFFRDIVGGVVREQRRLDPQIDAALACGWPLKRIEAVLRAVLRAGTYELACRRDVPARVVMSEYVDVASAFVDRDETGMVNAVLDQLAREFRADEVAGK